MDLSVEYKIEDCVHCGFNFALPASFVRRRKQDHEFFYCPSCQEGMHWPQLSNQERLARQLSDVQACCVMYEEKAKSLERTNIAIRGHLTRAKKKRNPE